MKKNQLICASAGTGKTFALATRFIRLMLFEDVLPQHMVALTFSRAAAQEIYTKLLDRLQAAAASETQAEKEWAILVAGLSPAARAAVATKRGAHLSLTFCALLRRVLAAQGQGTIATLDSFILRIVRSFPLEMGFQNAVEVLSGYEEELALFSACEQVLGAENAAEGFMENFRRATRGEFQRRCGTVLTQALRMGRDFLTSTLAVQPWTRASVGAALGIVEPLVKPDLTVLKTGKRSDLRDQFAAKFEHLTATTTVDWKTKLGQMILYLMQHPEATDYTFEQRGKAETLVFTPSVRASLQAGLRYWGEVVLLASLERMLAQLALCREVEAVYEQTTRRRGLLTFSDFTRCQAAAEEDAEKAICLQNLYYRFDERLSHWALDEFQDTSKMQWRCLERFVSEAASPDAGCSVLVVGDLKQSIYTWRGGNDEPFEALLAWRAFQGEWGEILTNDVSYRYGKQTCHFLNCVFGEKNLRQSGWLGEEVAPALATWLKERCWRPHSADPKVAADCVRLIAVDESANLERAEIKELDLGEAGAAMRILAPVLVAQVKALWQAHEAAQSDETVGVLVRDNRSGTVLAEALRAAQLPVVWEGEEGILASPLVQAVVQLLRLAEHPQDTFAWRMVETLFPLRELVFPERTHISSVAQAMARQLSQLGLARTVREVVAKVNASWARLDARSRDGLERLVRAAVVFEQRREASRGVDDFETYLASTAGREQTTSPQVIRILTIHRAKGLTLDRVVVPILETGTTEAINRPRRGTVLTGEGWALPGISAEIARLNPVVYKAWQAAANARLLEQLRLYYVALTRARRETMVLVCAGPHAGCVQFRDLVCAPFANEEAHELVGGRELVCLGERPPFERGTRQEIGRGAEAHPQWEYLAGEKRVSRRTPSSEMGLPHLSRFSGASLFAPSGESAFERGSQAHQQYAALEWLDPAAISDPLAREIFTQGWQEAFVRGPEVTGLWRERRYEWFADGVWETGQFDRVVFTGQGASRAATIYDFKTNTPQPTEAAAAFAQRMSETYAGQMARYRAALVALTGLAPTRVRTVLLLSAIGGLVEVIAGGEK